MIITFILGTLFGLLFGMVLNHAIEEAERKRSELERLREIMESYYWKGDNENYN